MAITYALDISHHQDKALSLAQARRDGCELVLIKAGEGDSFVDPDFAANLAEARAAGQIVAAYWYQRSTATAAGHVAKIRATVPAGVPVVMDVEANSGNVALTRDIVGRLNVAGVRTPLLYIPRWYWQQIGSPSLAGLPPLWSSRYPNNVVGALADEWAEVPASYWDGYGGLSVALLQFTSSARIAGYAPLDASAYRGTRDQLAALFGQGGGSTAGGGTTQDQGDEVDSVIGTGKGDNAPWQDLHCPINGGQYLRIAATYNRTVVIDGISMIDDTPGGEGSNGRTVQQGGAVLPDRPGPWNLAVADANFANYSHVVVRLKAEVGAKVSGWVNNRG